MDQTLRVATQNNESRCIDLRNNLNAGEGCASQPELSAVRSHPISLIIHADDLGMARSINDAVFAAMCSGAVSSASIMVPSHQFGHAAEVFSCNSAFDIGVHATFTSEWSGYRWSPVSNPSHVPSLIDSHGYLWQTMSLFLEHATPQDVRIELDAQIDTALRAKLRLTHIDSHMFCLLRDEIFLEILIDAGRRFGLPVAVCRSDVKRHFGPNAPAHASILAGLYCAGTRLAAQTWEASYRHTLRMLTRGVHQLIVHPGYANNELLGIMGAHTAFGAWWRQRDFDVISGTPFRSDLVTLGIHVGTWREICANNGSTEHRENPCEQHR